MPFMPRSQSLIKMALPATEPTNYDHDSWGWIMVAAAFVNCFVIMGQLKAFGVLLIPITDDLDSDLWLIGWVAVLYHIVPNCFGKDCS